VNAQIIVTQRGYYDTAHEYKVALLAEGEKLDVLHEQGDAPCRGKRGRGVWCAGKERPVFIEDGCYRAAIARATGEREGSNMSTPQTRQADALAREICDGIRYTDQRNLETAAQDLADKARRHAQKVKTMPACAQCGCDVSDPDRAYHAAGCMSEEVAPPVGERREAVNGKAVSA